MIIEECGWSSNRAFFIAFEINRLDGYSYGVFLMDHVSGAECSLVLEEYCEKVAPMVLQKMIAVFG